MELDETKGLDVEGDDLISEGGGMSNKLENEEGGGRIERRMYYMATAWAPILHMMLLGKTPLRSHNWIAKKGTVRWFVRDVGKINQSLTA